MEERTFQCLSCGTKFEVEEALSAHMSLDCEKSTVDDVVFEKIHEATENVLNAMNALADLESSGLKMVMFVSNGEHGGVTTIGYEDSEEAAGDVLSGLKAILNSIGKDILVVNAGIPTPN